MQHYRIASVIFTKLLMNRIRIDAMEEVQSAYKNDQGIILQRPEAFTRVRFVIPYWLRAHNFKNLFQRFYGDGTDVVVGKHFQQHIQTSVNDIDVLFESIFSIQDSIKSDENYQYSFLFQKFTADGRLKSLQSDAVFRKIEQKQAIEEKHEQKEEKTLEFVFLLNPKLISAPVVNI